MNFCRSLGLVVAILVSSSCSTAHKASSPGPANSPRNPASKITGKIQLDSREVHVASKGAIVILTVPDQIDFARVSNTLVEILPRQMAVFEVMGMPNKIGTLSEPFVVQILEEGKGEPTAVVLPVDTEVSFFGSSYSDIDHLIFRKQ